YQRGTKKQPERYRVEGGGFQVGGNVLDAKLSKVSKYGSLGWSRIMPIRSDQVSKSNLGVRQPGENLMKVPVYDAEQELFGGQLGLKIQSLRTGAEEFLGYAYRLSLQEKESEQTLFDGIVGGTIYRPNYSIMPKMHFNPFNRIVALQFGGKLHFAKLEELGINVKKYAAKSEKTEPQLTVSTRVPVTILTEPVTKVKFQATGGKGSYTFKTVNPFNPRFPSVDKRLDPTWMDPKTGVLEIKLGAARQELSIPSKFRKLFEAAKEEGKPTKEVVEQYIAEVNADLKGIVRKPFRDVPFRMQVKAIAEDSQGATGSILHDVILVVPLDDVLKALPQ
ncbi:MAG: hypothetical protein AAF483_31025, partial [Planctomycetota bacterium]